MLFLWATTGLSIKNTPPIAASDNRAAEKNDLLTFTMQLLGEAGRILPRTAQTRFGTNLLKS
jgi:hypothetical protein